MKKQLDNKYLRKFKDTAKHEGTYPFHAGNVVTDKIPSYHGSGREVEYKRILPPLRDPLDIDENLFTEIMHEVCPEFNIVDLRLKNGLCSIGRVKFRYTDIKSLLKSLREEKYLSFSIDSVYNLYNTRYHKF